MPVLSVLSYNLCQFLLDKIDRRLFLFKQQSAFPWDLTDLHTSRGARSVHDLGLTIPPYVPPFRTSRGARAVHDLSLSPPSSVDNFVAPLLWQLAPYACCKDNMRRQGAAWES